MGGKAADEPGPLVAGLGAAADGQLAAADAADYRGELPAVAARGADVAPAVLHDIRTRRAMNRPQDGGTEPTHQWRDGERRRAVRQPQRAQTRKTAQEPPTRSHCLGDQRCFMTRVPT